MHTIMLSMADSEEEDYCPCGSGIPYKRCCGAE
ncbi:MAG: SEC-C metal-binding domain-containing protein [Candidatus Woesearchaeota archaeon]